jgi:L-ribulose-5-phosphate 4-epimerase
MKESMYELLKEETMLLNKQLVENGLVLFTWGNASICDPELDVIAIKPSGVPYSQLTAGDIVIMDMKGIILEGNKKPSSDTATHLELYNNFSKIKSIIHTHSRFATIFAQAKKEIECLGTTHADDFYGNIPITRDLNDKDISENYERNIGKVIIDTLSGKDPLLIPACLVSSHGPFVWGSTSGMALHNAILLEYLAEMNFHTISLTPEIQPLSSKLLDKHFLRKHGRTAYYGQ